MSSPEKAIHDAQRIDTFLKDDVIAGALARMERRYYEQFLAADSAEKRVTAWAKANMLRDLEHELRIITSAGEAEVLRIAREEAQKAKTNPRD